MFRLQNLPNDVEFISINVWLVNYENRPFLQIVLEELINCVLRSNGLINRLFLHSKFFFVL